MRGLHHVVGVVEALARARDGHVRSDANLRSPLAREVRDDELSRALVERSVGVALVPRLTAQSEITAGTLVALSVTEMRLNRKLNIVYRRNSSLSHAAEAFLKIAKDFGRQTPN